MKFKKILSVGLVALLAQNSVNAEMIVEHSLRNINYRREIQVRKKPTIEQITFNTFIRPNIISKGYYGDGDINLDGVIDRNDYNLIENGVKNDSGDLDGDGLIGSSDIIILENRINNNIIIPGDWNNLNNKLKDDWFMRMQLIDRTNEIPAKEENYEWLCHHYAIQECFNFSGFKKANESDNNPPAKFDLSKNGRFNLPVYYVYVLINENTAHAVNAVLIGDNPLNFNDWRFVEPQTDKIINKGGWDMPFGSEVWIEGIYEFLDAPYQDFFNSFLLLKFKINDDVSLMYRDENLVLTREDAIVSVKEDNRKFFVSAYPNPFNFSTTIEYSIPKISIIGLNIYDVLGRKVRTLENSSKGAGSHRAIWDGRDEQGNNVGNGVYLYQLRAGDYNKTGKLMLVK